MTEFTYSDELYSDFHKDVYGFRPRGILMDMWNDLEPAEKQEEWNRMSVRLDEALSYEEALRERDLDRFEELIIETMKLGAPDEVTALRWMLQGDEEDIQNSQELESWVYHYGILYTDRGREVLETLKRTLRLAR